MSRKCKQATRGLRMIYSTWSQARGNDFYWGWARFF